MRRRARWQAERVCDRVVVRRARSAVADRELLNIRNRQRGDTTFVPPDRETWYELHDVMSA
jgi:hypothetical protein